MSGKPKGIKKQVFGSILCSLGIIVIGLDLIATKKPELFYILLVVSGCLLFVFGWLQNRKK